MEKAKISGIGGAIVVGVLISLIIFQNPSTEVSDYNPESNQTTENQNQQQVVDSQTEQNQEIFGPAQDVETQMEEKYSDIEENVEKSEFTPAPRDWPTSGPFQIDRSQYLLGENIFVRIGELNPNERGQIAFLRPLNETHYSVYITIPFDGSAKGQFNQYFTPGLSKIQGICSKEDLVGSWRVVFQGTNYENLSFDIIDKILPGEDEYHETIC